VRFDAPIPTYLLTRLLGAISPRLLIGAHACTRYGEVPSPRLPGGRWVRVRPRLAGICGSDLAVIALEASPQTSPFSSFPFVLGHEVVGEVTETGTAVTAVRRGDRVVLNPLLACSAREIAPPCEACAGGNPSRCANFTSGSLPPGLLVGTTRGLGGGWGEELVAHESQAIRVPDAVGDEAAVFTEPLACSVRAVRAGMPRDGDRVLVIGAGSIGLLTVAALRALAPAATITLLARHDFQAREGTRLGAAHAVLAGDGYAQALAERTGARLVKPILGPDVAIGGFDATFVCVAGKRAMDDALRFTRAGGTVMLLGNAVTLDGIDWTPVWFKELTVRGTLCYGGAHAAATAGDFDAALALIGSGAAPVAPLLTHTFALPDCARAIGTAMDKRGGRCIKVAFRLG
jgi:threonine dehydrogenase-like Zn-dependent dehydrogenase